MLIGALLGLLVFACTPRGERIVDGAAYAHRIKECQAVDLARDRIREVKERLPDDDLERSLELNRHAVILCTLSAGEIADELNDITDRLP